MITTSANRILSANQEEFTSVYTGSANSLNNYNQQQQHQQQQLDEASGDLLGEEAPQEIIVEQTSKLGVIVQTKVLEEKMQSFITLMNENQLNKGEQRQVYDSIRVDYENLIKNYQQVKLNDSSGMLPNELDMDMYEAVLSSFFFFSSSSYSYMRY